MAKYAVVWFSDFNAKTFNFDFLKLSIQSFNKSNKTNNVDSILCLCKDESAKDVKNIEFCKSLGFTSILDITSYVQKYFPKMSKIPTLGLFNWPIETHAKMLVPIINELKAYDKILVIDPDILVFKDLQNTLFQTCTDKVMALFQLNAEFRGVFNVMYYSRIKNYISYFKEKYNLDMLAYYGKNDIVANCGAVLINNNADKTYVDQHMKLLNCYDQMFTDINIKDVFAYADQTVINLFVDFDFVFGGKTYVQSMAYSTPAEIVLLHTIATDRKLRLNYYNDLVKKYQLI